MKCKNALLQTLASGINPVYFTTEMTHGGYFLYMADLNWFQLKTYGRCMDVANGMAAAMGSAFSSTTATARMRSGGPTTTVSSARGSTPLRTARITAGRLMKRTDSALDPRHQQPEIRLDWHVDTQPQQQHLRGGCLWFGVRLAHGQWTYNGGVNWGSG
ncbi:MAG: hypothetical protein U1F16_02095 [Turneriella sp.]